MELFILYSILHVLEELMFTTHMMKTYVSSVWSEELSTSKYVHNENLIFEELAFSQLT